MNKRLYFLISAYVIFALMACRTQRIAVLEDNFKGQVFEEKYNAMPMVDRPNSKGAPLCTSLYIYKSINLQQLDSLSGHFCSRIQGDLVSKIQSNKDGSFNTHLEPGVYSIFVGYETAYYIPYFSGSQWTALFEIKKNESTNLEIIVRGNTNIQ
jgi:hypothetical protein